MEREGIIRLTLKQFNELVSQALEEIPENFLKKLENVEIVIEEDPSPDLLRELGLGRDDVLFGLYQGIPLPEKSTFQGLSLPDRIALFRNPIVRISRSKEQVLEQIKKTLVHEIAHHFGFAEKKIRRLGF